MQINFNHQDHHNHQTNKRKHIKKIIIKETSCGTIDNDDRQT